jgi:hypothetical protein
MTRPASLHPARPAVAAPDWAAGEPAASVAAGEYAAETSLFLFLAAAFPPGIERSTSLAALIFAHGAADALATRNRLGRRDRARLDRSLLRAIEAGSRRGVGPWRRTLRAIEDTPRGRDLHDLGRAAAIAWLRGNSPAPHVRFALATAS